jgi:hypothetical protein
MNVFAIDLDRAKAALSHARIQRYQSMLRRDVAGAFEWEAKARDLESQIRAIEARRMPA